jgi:hypothetical protein
VLQCFYNVKSVFLAVNASLHWLHNVSGALNPGFLASYWSEGFGRFLQVSALAFHWLMEDYANFTLTPEENNQASSQSTFIIEQLYSTCDYQK